MSETILSFDTCFDACSVAVQHAETGAITTERELMRRGHAEALVPMIDRTMRAANLAFADLDRIAVTHGPGTFTGARVGMSAALGLAFAHNLPVVTYSSLQCIARAAIDILGEGHEWDGVLVARDAKRDSVYLEVTDMAGNERVAPALMSIADANALVSSGSYFALGTGIAVMAAGAGGDIDSLSTTWPTEPPPGFKEPDARYLLWDAATRAPSSSPSPLYLRAPDAKPSSTPPLPRITAHPSRSTDA